jgi:YidC/Oxa1 family membrane protein insertase
VALAAAPGAGALLWGGLESTYFASLLLPERTDAGSVTFAPVALPSPADPKNPAHLAARFAPPAAPASFTVMVGPKDYDLLVGLDRELDHAIDFSRYSIIYVLTKYLFIALRWVNSYIGNYGLSIVILTILIRAGFFPLTYRSAITMRQNMKKMQRIQPKVKAIQERYKKTKRTMDSQRQMNDEIMALYRKENMNPMGSLGGCLPMLLQMPVFIAFYNLLSVTIELRGAPFVGWIHDLSRMDPYYIWPILMGASWMVQQWMTSSSIPDPMQRRMMGMMPLIFTFMMAHMPSGLVIYWFISNVVGLGQQWLINRHADRMPAEAG